MRVALSMLTLVPGISGGSETYARELTKGLARVGRHDYSVLLPPIAPDAGGGLPAAVAREYAASTGRARRLLAMGSARVRPGALRTLPCRRGRDPLPADGSRAARSPVRT